MYADSLLGITQNFLTPDIVNKFSSAIGETTEKTQKGLKTVIPALLMGIVNKAQTKDGAESLVNLAHKDGLEGEKTPDYADASYLSKGSDAVQGIFGNNLNTVVSKLGDSTGIQSSGIQKMLGMAAPLVMGFLGTKIKRDGLSTPGLMGFLGQQKSALSSLVPDGLGGRFTGAAAAGFAGAATSGVTGSAAKGVNAVGRRVGVVETRRSPWLTISLIALAVLAGLWWYTGRKSISNLTTATSNVISQTRQAVSKVAPATSTAMAPTVDQLTAFLKSGSTELPKTFRFENLNFDTGATTLMTGSAVEIDKIANSLKEYPGATARIEGYTDNTGSEAANLELSAGRAAAVKTELVSRGIDGGRIETVGMGSSKPLASNDNEAGRTQNRRIEFVVTRIK